MKPPKKKILLISEILLHYRISLYNLFWSLFNENNIELLLMADKENNKELRSEFNYIEVDFSFFKIIKHIKQAQPEMIIFFWNIHNVSSWLIALWIKWKGIKLIYWSHGGSMQDPENKLKKFVYKVFHNLSDSIILYSKNELKFISEKNRRKTFIANNTINFNDIPVIELSKEEIKKELGLPFKKIVLFVGRIQKRKRLDVLINIFSNRNDKDIGLVIAGPDMQEDYNDIIKKSRNIIYLGAIYDKYAVNKLFKCSDLFCIPGTNGLGINQAMYWGLPVLALNVQHSPEIYYVKDGLNGYIVNNKKELEDKIFNILNDDLLLKTLSKNAHEIIRKEGTPQIMIEGFFNAINYISNARDKND